MQKPRLFAASLGVVALTLLPSCQDEDFGYTAEQIKYEKAYKDFFGEMPADKNWDLSSSVNHYHYDSDDNSLTRANGITPTGNQLQNSNDGEYQVKEDWWPVPQKTFDWMKAALKEGKDNRYLGSPFVLQLPDNDFAIIPIFQGKSSIMSELEVKINGYQITKIWTRSENIQVKDSHTKNGVTANDWTNIGYYDGYSGYDKGTMQKEHNNLHMYPSYTDEADAVRAKPIYFRTKEKIGTSEKGFMYLSLHNIDKAWASWTNWEERWDNNNEWTTIGHRLTSINPQGHMLALNVPSQYRPAPSELPDICEDGTTKPSQVIFVSCEDANGTGTDHDVNDVAFLIIGYPNAPTIVPTTEVIKKRYMCEDLGGTYDYDFNDIVVDVTQTRKYKVSAEPDDLENYDGAVAGGITIKDMIPDGCPVQTAKVARLCGTIPVQIQIGNFMFPKIKNPRNNNNADGTGTDGKYSTRVELAGNDGDNNYYLYNHVHCSTCGSDHSNPTQGSREKYGHKNITRGADDQVNTTSGWNPNEEQIIPCHTWNPDENNIVIYADWGYSKKMYSAATVTEEINVKNSNPFPSNTQDFADFASGKKFAVTFPKTGQYPYIIATDQDVPWMKEEQHIPVEWIEGDMTARSSGTNGSNHDLIGNSFYMENYGSGDHFEGYIWSGDVTGLAGSTGVTFAKPSAELNAMDEAMGTLNGGHGYYLLHVYVEVPAGETASIGLYNSTTWEPILNSDPDGYLAVPYTERLHQTAIGINESTMHCATIYLTKEQRDYILQNGVTIASRTDGVHIRKITTARPCCYDTNASTGNNLDAGFIIDLKKESITNGTIRSNESERIKWLYKEESGKELTAEQTNHNNGEDARVIVPFTSHQYISGTNVTLTAIGAPHSNPDKSYKFKEWHIAYPTNVSISDGKFTFKDASGTVISSNVAKTNPLTITNTNVNKYNQWTQDQSVIPHIQLYPEFEEADNPHLAFKDGHASKKTVTIVLGGGAATVLASSDNYVTALAPFGANSEIVTVACSIDSNKDHKITLTPQAVGETKFILYQADGDDNTENKHWGVSGELELTVKVIESIPEATVALAPSMVYQWNNGTNSAYIIDNPSSKTDIKNITGTDVTSTWGNNDPAFGQVNGDYQKYVDLPNANVLVVAVNSGDIELHLNKQYGTPEYPQFNGDRVRISETENPEYCSVILNGVDGKKTYIFDLKAVRQKYGYVHLNSICSLHNTVANVYSMKVDNANSGIRSKWDELKAKISTATKPSSVDLLEKFFQWTDEGANADIVGRTATDYKWLQTETAVASGEVVYGHVSSHSRHYADLTPATVLVVTIPQIAYNSTEAKEEIWFQFNKQYGDNGWGSAKEVHATDRDVCAVVTDGSNYKYVLDLDALKNKWGVSYMHLNAINANWGNNHKMAITDVKVDAYYSSVEDAWKAMTSPVDLAKSMMLTWSSGNATGTPNDCEYHATTGGDNTSSDVVYGVGGIYGMNTYADLSSADWMKIEFEDANAYDEVRLWFNKTTDDNNSALLVNGSNSTYALRAGNSIIVKLKDIKTGTGKCRLHTIKSSASGKNIKVKRIILDKYTAPSGADQPVNMTLTTAKDEQYNKIVSVSGWSIWNDVLKSGAISEYSSLKFTIHLETGVMNYYIYNNQGVAGSGDKQFSKQLKDGDNWINSATFNSSTRELTYTLSKSDFQDYFQGINPQSDIYFGGNSPLADKITVQVVR